ncbi:MAG TPA: hypothetical protein VJ485_02940 [archaeon]|nr:hypothetical protein [archaeon]
MKIISCRIDKRISRFSLKSRFVEIAPGNAGVIRVVKIIVILGYKSHITVGKIRICEYIIFQFIACPGSCPIGNSLKFDVIKNVIVNQDVINRGSRSQESNYARGGDELIAVSSIEDVIVEADMVIHCTTQISDIAGSQYVNKFIVAKYYIVLSPAVSRLHSLPMPIRIEAPSGFFQAVIFKEKTDIPIGKSRSLMAAEGQSVAADIVDPAIADLYVGTGISGRIILVHSIG